MSASWVTFPWEGVNYAPWNYLSLAGKTCLLPRETQLSVRGSGRTPHARWGVSGQQGPSGGTGDRGGTFRPGRLSHNPEARCLAKPGLAPRRSFFSLPPLFFFLHTSARRSFCLVFPTST